MIDLDTAHWAEKWGELNSTSSRSIFMVKRYNTNHDDNGRFSSGGGIVKGKDLIGSNLNDPMVNSDLEKWSTDRLDNPTEDKSLEAIAAKQGFDGEAPIVGRAEFDQIQKDGGTVTYRGQMPFKNEDGKLLKGEALTTNFASGNYWAGTGINGNGIYSSTNPKLAENFASQNNKTGGMVTTMVISPKANIASWDQVSATLEEMRDPSAPRGLDIGRIMAARGFDGYAISTLQRPEVVMLNRTAISILGPGK